MAAFEERGDRRSIVCDDFTLDFERVNDRWTHAIALTLLGLPHTIARSVEWDDRRDDPSRVISPVFQELHFQTDVSGIHQALLVGMSGNHHFSAVFSFGESTEGVAIDVDVADRVRGDVVAVGSTYSVSLASGDLVACDESKIVWGVADHRLLFVAGRDVQIGLAEAGRQATHVQAGIVVKPVSPTHRWRYSWHYLRGTD